MQEPFDEVMPYLLLWKEQEEFFERYHEQNELLNGNPKN